MPTLIQDDTVNVTVSQPTTSVIVGVPGVQGPPGVDGAGYITGFLGVTGISISGGNSITGLINVNAGSNITLTQIGTNSFSIASSAGGGDISGLISTGNADIRYLSINSGGLYYLKSNPSGYITGFNSGLYVLNSDTGSYTGLFVTRSETGQFYPISNPQQYIRSGDVSNSYATIANLENTGNNLQGQINTINLNTGGFTGSFYPRFLNPSGYTNTAYVDAASNSLSTRLGDTGSYLYGLINASSAGVSSINSASGALTINGGGNVSVTTTSQTITVSGNTGFLSNYYSVFNPTKFTNSGNFYTGNADGQFREVWIAARNDGISGNGSAYNPYDGSTASKLEKVFKDLSDYTGTINFFAGQYYLYPANQVSFAWNCGNWDIKGAGIDRTIITATGYGPSGAGYYCLLSSNDRPINSFSIQDLTLDGGTRTSGVAVVLLQMFQPNSTARRLKVKNFGSADINYECFPIIFSPYYANTTQFVNCLIEDCIAVDPWTGNSAGVSTFVISPALTEGPLVETRNTDTSCVIRGCYVNLGSGILGANMGYSHAFTSPVIENNYCKNVGVGAYYDTYHEKNIFIKDNTFLNCNIGIQLNFNGNSYKKDAVLVKDNFIELNSKRHNPSDTTYQGIFLYGAGGGSPYTFNHVNISNNRVGTVSGIMHPNIFYVGISAHGIHNLIIKDNVVGDFDLNATPGYLIQDSINYGKIQVWNNFTTGLRAINNINCPYLTAGITGISITGGNSITGLLNIQAGSNITLVQGGNNTLTVTLAAGIPQLYVGSGSPEGVISATSGSIYSDYFNQLQYNKFTGNAQWGWA